MASLLSFEDLFSDLRKFIPDENETWSECVKVKRGICDTSEKRGFFKD